MLGFNILSKPTENENLFLPLIFRLVHHMAGSSQPQHFFDAGCVFADFAIAVIFYPTIKSF